MTPQYDVGDEFRKKAQALNRDLMRAAARQYPGVWWMRAPTLNKSFRKWSQELLGDRELFDLYLQWTREYPSTTN